MKKLIVTCAVLAAAVGSVHAQTTPDHELSFNVGLVSDYRYRGISQSRLRPAVQGGVDYTHAATGVYVGAWASSIKWIRDAGGDSRAELDLYGGKRGAFGNGLSYDVGALTYVYPSNRLAPSANTTEVYGRLGFGPAYFKYSHALTNLFGFVDSKHSAYLDLGAAFEVGDGYALNLQVGRQRVRSNAGFSYTDWKVGVSKDFGLIEGALAVVGTDNRNYLSPTGRNLGRTGLVLSASKSF
jgi:uncharacterized protein (TIGR02001 family)